MNLAEECAVLVLAEKIARGEVFHAGMMVNGLNEQKTTVTPEMLERATSIAMERDEHGFVGGAEEHAKNEAARAKAAATAAAAAARKKAEEAKAET